MNHLTVRKIQNLLLIWRKAHHLTLREASEILEFSNPFLSQFERGKPGIGFDEGHLLLDGMIRYSKSRRDK